MLNLFEVQAVQAVFLRAMASGWAKDGNEVTIPEMPTAKAIDYILGDFRVLDYYLVNPDSNRSTGTTTIWHKGTPVWVMNYGGEYAKVAIPFLKSCLCRAYVDERQFYGGRGPTFVRDELFTYVNRVERNDFNDFFGEERVFDISGQCFGYHWYRGMSLL